MFPPKFFVAVYRLKACWVFATQGIFGAGFYRVLEPVHVFKLDEWEKVVQTLTLMSEAGNPPTVPPTRREMQDRKPFLSAIDIKSWGELYRYCYLWNFKDVESEVIADVYERRKKKPILTQAYPNFKDAIEAMGAFKYNF